MAETDVDDLPRGKVWGCEHGIEEGWSCPSAGGTVGNNGEPLTLIDEP